jgi:four helix bundle protein
MSSSRPRGASAPIQSHRDLIVWQKARKLAALSYSLARLLPKEEQYGMKPQMQRAAVSVAGNIAEGHGSIGKGNFARHLSHARGSLSELMCLIEIGSDVGYFDLDQTKTPLAIADEVSRMLWTLVKKLGSRQILPRTVS